MRDLVTKKVEGDGTQSCPLTSADTHVTPTPTKGEKTTIKTCLNRTTQAMNSIFDTDYKYVVNIWCRQETVSL